MASAPLFGIGKGTPGSTLSMAMPPSRAWVATAFFLLLSSTAWGKAALRWVG